MELIAISFIAGSLAAGILVNSMPFFTLEKMIFADLYGTEELPAEGYPVFRFTFWLFCLLSVVVGLFQFFLVRHGVRKNEKWAFNCLVWGALIWGVGATGIAIFSGAISYLYSAILMAVLLGLPLIIIYPQFKNLNK